MAAVPNSEDTEADKAQLENRSYRLTPHFLPSGLVVHCLEGDLNCHTAFNGQINSNRCNGQILKTYASSIK